MSEIKKIKLNGTVYDLTAETDTTDLLKKSELLQSTGNKTNNTMSQKAITDELQNKQHVLTAGNNITIENNVISSTGGVGTETDSIFSASASANITSQDITNWNNKGTYSKPNGGIPKTDLASDVQTSLGKADTALQAHQDITGKEDKTNKVTSISSSSTDTQYPSAKCVYDIVGNIETLLGGI